MKRRRNAILWAIGWWIVRREVRRRTENAVAGVSMGAATQRGRVRAVLGGILLVGLLGGAFVAWRRLSSSNGELAPSEPPVPLAPTEPPPDAVPA